MVDTFKQKTRLRPDADPTSNPKGLFSTGSSDFGSGRIEIWTGSAKSTGYSSGSGSGSGASLSSLRLESLLGETVTFAGV